MDTASVWAAFYPDRYRVDAKLIAANTAGCAQYLPNCSVVREDGFAFVKRSAETPLHAHLSAVGFLEAAQGRLIVSKARSLLAAEGFETWQFGGDRRHFFPGCPKDCQELSAFLESFGLVAAGDPVFDLERDLASYDPPCQASAAVRACRDEDEKGLFAFFEREFPGRWKDDVMEKFAEDPSRVYGLFLEGTCEGFAMTQMDGDAMRRAGAVWSHDLGAQWAALGPIGVSKALRGRGLGDGLLAAALCSLRDQGARRTIIDWTVLTKFYGRHGFVPTREYVTLKGSLL